MVATAPRIKCASPKSLHTTIVKLYLNFYVLGKCIKSLHILIQCKFYK
jgi:hypothetical protein